MLITILIAILLSLVSLLFLSRTNPKHKLPPGPFSLPIIGNLHQISGDIPHRSLHKLSQKYGPLMYLKLGTIPTIVASSAEIAKEFLKIHDLECCSRPFLAATDKLTYGFRDVAFSPYDKNWRELRKILILQLFSLKRVTSFRYIREEEVERMISSISSQCSEVNLSAQLLSLSNNVTCRSALGRRYDVDGGRLCKMLNEAQEMLNGFYVGDYVPMLGWIYGLMGMRARLERSFRELDKFYDEVIEEHLEQKRREDEKKYEDVLDALLDMQKTDGHLITLEHIKGILMNILIGGTDTSSALVEWVMTELMRNPEAMKKAQNEVRNLIGNKSKVEESDLDQLHYMKSVIKETMRLHSVGPLLIQRETMQHFKINGYDIPAKTRLFINVWAIGRDENIWKNPEEFYPERFMDSPIDFRGHHFELIPFGAGRRICPGLDSGMHVVELVLANLLCLFNWEMPKGMTNEDIDMSESLGVALHRRFSLNLVAKEFVRVKG